MLNQSSCTVHRAGALCPRSPPGPCDQGVCNRVGAAGQEQGHGMLLGAETSTEEQCANLLAFPPLHNLERACLGSWTPVVSSM